MLISTLLADYARAGLHPVQVMEEVLGRIARAPERNAWITLLPHERVLALARALLSVRRTPCLSTASRSRSRTTSTSRHSYDSGLPRIRLYTVRVRIRGSEAHRCGCHPRGQDQPRPVCYGPRGYPLSLRCLSQQLRSCLHLGWLERRVGRDSRYGAREFRVGYRYRRFGSRARRLQQSDRLQTDAGCAELSRRRASLPLTGFGVDFCIDCG